MRVRIAIMVAVLSPAGSRVAPVVWSQEMPAEYQQAQKTVGKSGDYKASVLKVNIPRNAKSCAANGSVTAPSNRTESLAKQRFIVHPDERRRKLLQTRKLRSIRRPSNEGKRAGVCAALLNSSVCAALGQDAASAAS